ncbi:MAG TPA: hypothetical protein VD966_08675, partial [Pyrinomonadaceae bacterium]|nr:hypothetical protein [Pyrinomonadaceae bacterium]
MVDLIALPIALFEVGKAELQGLREESGDLETVADQKMSGGQAADAQIKGILMGKPAVLPRQGLGIG